MLEDNQSKFELLHFLNCVITVHNKGQESFVLTGSVVIKHSTQVESLMKNVQTQIPQ